MMNCELLAVCSALGYLEEDAYYKEEDCIDSVKCLIKYLQNEDNTRDIRNQLGAAHILQNDLLPIINQHSDDSDLFSCVLRLIINLTQPALLCFNGKIPKEAVMNYHFLNVVSYNQDYKEAFGKNSQVWNVLKKKIYAILDLKWEDRKPEDSLLVERCLILIRNLLHTPATTEDHHKTAQELSSQDNLIWQMHNAGFDHLLLYMVGSNEEQQWTLHLMEIICLLLKEQNAAKLIEVDAEASKAAREKEGNELEAMRKTEEARRKIVRAKLTARHSRFGGTFVSRGTKALCEDNDVVLHRSLQHCRTITYDEGKTPVKKAKNRRAIIEEVVERHSSRGIRAILNSFCKDFLERGYNLCMRTTKSRLQRESAQDHDETFYFWMMSFFLKFNRLSDFKVQYVSETLNLSTLHFIDSNLLNYYELMLNDKQDARVWSRRLHLALRCYHEFLTSVQLMHNSDDFKLQNSAKVLLNNIFYVVEHREIFVIILRKFDERKQCQAFLRDAILTTHLFLKMFESYCKDGSVVVEKRIKNTKVKRKKAKKIIKLKEYTFDEKVAKWKEVLNDVNHHLQIIDKEDQFDRVVFDPASELSNEEQQQIALLEIQNLILNNQISEGLQHYYSSRKIWPETGIFGSDDNTNEDEAKLINEIVLADLTSIAKVKAQNINLTSKEEDVEEEDLDEEEEYRSSRANFSKREIEISYKDYIKKFADPNVIRSYATLLKSYETNGQHLNHCIVKMFHRVAYQLKMYGFLFQASIFRVFQKIHSLASYDESYHEIVTLGDWVLQKFFEVFHRNPTVIAELLFWKQNVNHCFEISEGYGSTGLFNNKKSKSSSWTDEEVEELERLFTFHRSKLETGELLDSILSDINDENRSRIQVRNKLLQLGLVTDPNLLKRNKGSKSSIWRPDDVDELKRLFEEFKNCDDPVGCILPMLTRKRSRSMIIDKILSLELVNDRKQLFKKRSQHHRSSETSTSSHDKPGTSRSTYQIDEDSDESDNENLLLETDQSMSSLVTQMRDHDDSLALLDSIEWLTRSLKQIADDRSIDKKAENSSNTTQAHLPPLVPFTENQETALHNRFFKILLLKIGLQHPSSDQVFWRVPLSLDSTKLDSSIEQLKSININKEARFHLFFSIFYLLTVFL